jgi:hypothetical protein
VTDRFARRNTRFLGSTRSWEPPSFPVVRAGARSPEELETLLEDAILTHDVDGLEALFEADAVLSVDDGAIVAEGRHEIVDVVTAPWRRIYVAHPSTVLRSGDTSLVLGPQAVSVTRRGHDRCWRYAICVLSHDITNPEGVEPCNRRRGTMR